MPATNKFTIGGAEWQILPLGVPEQVEVEIAMANVCGGAAAVAIGAAVQGLAPAVVEVLRDITGEKSSFDLAHIATLWSDEDGVGLDTSDPRLERAWETLLGALADTIGDVVIQALPAVTDRLTVPLAMRMLEITADRLYCETGSGTAHIRTMEKFTEAMRGHPPGLKWRLFRAVIAVTYGGDVPEDVVIDLDADPEPGEPDAGTA